MGWKAAGHESLQSVRLKVMLDWTVHERLNDGHFNELSYYLRKVSYKWSDEVDLFVAISSIYKDV